MMRNFRAVGTVTVVVAGLFIISTPLKATGPNSPRTLQGVAEVQLEARVGRPLEECKSDICESMKEVIRDLQSTHVKAPEDRQFAMIMLRLDEALSKLAKKQLEQGTDPEIRQWSETAIRRSALDKGHLEAWLDKEKRKYERQGSQAAGTATQ